MATDADPMLSHHLSDLGGSLTRSVEHLLIGEPDGCPAIDRGIEVALEIFVPCACRVVKQAAVEFDNEPFRVFGVAVDHAGRGDGAGLPLGPRQAMRSLDAIAVSVFEN